MRSARPARSFMTSMKWRVTLGLGVVLIAVVVAAIILQRAEMSTTAAHVVIFRGEHLAASVTAEQMGALSPSAVHYGEAVFDAVPLRDLLEHHAAMPTLYESAACVGSETLVIGGGELLREKGIYVAYALEEAAIAPADGGPFVLLYITRDGEASRVDGLLTVRVNLQE